MTRTLVAVFSVWAATAALTVSHAPLRFVDVAAQAGVTAAMRCGGPEKRWIPEANGSGAAWFDYDNDGLVDLMIVNGGRNMDHFREILSESKALTPDKAGVYLYHNLGNGRFEDVTARSGLVNPYWGTGANAADFNNDGFPDVLITTIGRDLLFKNNGNGTFTEVGQAAGLRQSTAWHTGSAFGDFDNDGRLDLFISGYVNIHSLSWKEPAPVCDYFGQHVFCGPIGLEGERSVLYHNNGDGTFSDVSAKAGIAGVPRAHGFTPVAADLNSDGKLDVFVANDSDPNYLFINRGDGTFKEEALEHGLAFNADGRAQSNMGVAIGHYGSGQRLDLFTTVFSRDYFPQFRESSISGAYEEIASSTGIATLTNNYLGWACGLTDFDNAGTDDFWAANGHVYPTDKDYFQPVVILRSEGAKSSPAFVYPSPPSNSYRGGAAADFDNDGRMDLVILPISGRPVLLKNETATDSSWIGLTLVGEKSNRDAIGATVTLSACGKQHTDTVRNGGSYLSRNDSRLHFGLGACKSVDSGTVRWPDGLTQQVSHLALNAYSTIREGSVK